VYIPTLAMVLAAKFPDVERARRRINEADRKIKEALEKGHTWHNTPWPNHRVIFDEQGMAVDVVEVEEGDEDGTDEDENELREIWLSSRLKFSRLVLRPTHAQIMLTVQRSIPAGGRNASAARMLKIFPLKISDESSRLHPPCLLCPLERPTKTPVQKNVHYGDQNPILCLDVVGVSVLRTQVETVSMSYSHYLTYSSL